MKTYLRPFLKIEVVAASGDTFTFLYFSVTLATASLIGNGPGDGSDAGPGAPAGEAEDGSVKSPASGRRRGRRGGRRRSRARASNGPKSNGD